MVLVIFRRFFNFELFFGPFLGTLVENSKHKKVAPGKIPNIDIWVPKMRFWGPNWVGGAWYGIFLIREKPAGARASRGLDNKLNKLVIFIS